MSGPRRAAILAVGSELLTPLRIDTNSLYIAGRLESLGIGLAFKSVIGDDRTELAHALIDALQRVDLVLCCGGLGPTDDDVTRDVVADVLRRPLREDPAVVARIEARFASRGYPPPMPDRNRRQAMVPVGADVLPNGTGSAPGLWIEEGTRTIVLLPGPPRELKPMVEALVQGRLRALAGGSPLVRRVLRITNRIESQVDEVLSPLYAQWGRGQVPVSATILAALGQIELHLSAAAEQLAAADAALDAAVSDVARVLGPDLFTTEGGSMEAVVGALLAARGWRLAVAESCTGGLLTSRLTDVSGSSRYVDRAVVAYSNAAKIAQLGVEPALIERHGAVSEPVALAMASGVRALAGVEVGVGVTGIAGPEGGTADKPVGQVAIAAAGPGAPRVRTFRFPGDREQVKFQASQAALDMLRRLLIER